MPVMNESTILSRVSLVLIDADASSSVAAPVLIDADAS
jgi:hypothetical protein